MAIDGKLRGRLEPGTKLVARYKGKEHTAEVVAGEDRVHYRLADGREFKSPSAAGSAVIGGIACNGWRFWSLVDEAGTPAKASAPRKPRTKRSPRAQADAGSGAA